MRVRNKDDTRPINLPVVHLTTRMYIKHFTLKFNILFFLFQNKKRLLRTYHVNPAKLSRIESIGFFSISAQMTLVCISIRKFFYFCSTFARYFAARYWRLQ